MTHHNICDECETVAHCSNHGCIPKQQALDKMAENARELGLDYEPAQQEPVAMSFDDAWASLRWAEWRMRPPKELFAELHRLTSPPAQRTWVGLTQEEIDLVWDSVPETQFWWRNYAKAIEVALKEKNT